MAVGQDVVFHAGVDKNPVSSGDVFSLRLTLENGRGEITPPDLSDWNVIFGPSQSSSYRIVNGKQSSTITLSYTMRPKAIGKFIIESATARVADEVFRTEPIVVEVVKGSAPAQQNTTPQRGTQGNARAALQTQSDENLKVQIQLSKSNVYQGEQIVVTYVLLSRYNNIDLGETDFPTMSGFWTEDVKSTQTTWEDQYEMINGVPYRKAILRRQVIFPQRSGKLEIEPFKLSARVNRSFFSQGTEVRAASNTPVVNVKPLPGNAPEAFDGAVGDFSFSVQTPDKALEVNGAIDMKITISGQGNLTLLKKPNIIFPQDFQAYDPELENRVNVTAGGVSGSKTYQYLLIPQYPGQYEIPEITFAWFDPVKAQYFTRKHGPIQLEVGGEAGLTGGPGDQVARSKVQQTRDDIRYIKTNADKLVPSGKYFFGSVGYYAAIGTPVLLFFAFILVRRRREALEGDVKGSRRRKANKMARRRLSTAEKAMKTGDSKLFYSEIFSGLYGYLGDKLGVSSANLSKPLIRQKLAEHNAAEDTIAETIDVIETCEMARFAPTAQESDEAFYRRTVQLIENLEGSIQ